MSLVTSPARYLPVDRVSLTAEQLNQAIAACASISDSDRQWQTYLNYLASFGIEQWLAQRDAVLAARSHPVILNGADPVRIITIEHRRLIPLATELLYEPMLFVPEAIAHLPAHYYAWAEVLEELGDVLIRGYMSAEHLQTCCTDMEMSDRQRGYLIPVDEFQEDVDQLLFDLRSTVAGWLPPSAAMDTTAIPESVPDSISDSVINIWQWFTQTVTTTVEQIGEQVNERGQALTWTLLPPLMPAYGFRSVRSPLEDVAHAIAQLTENGLEIPATTRAAYRDIQWEGTAMRLYAIAWILPSNEWTLLVILSGQPNGVLQPGISLQIRDEQTILESPVLTEPNQAYLYAQVIGEPTERFEVTVQLPNGSAIIFPPFIFEPTPDNQ